MAGAKRNRTRDLMFEGVVIPGGTLSGKLAAKGIKNEEDLGRFLTAIFSDTLKGKIVLPKPVEGGETSSSLLNGVEQKLRRGLPVTIEGVEPKGKKGRKAKKEAEPETGNQS